MTKVYLKYNPFTVVTELAFIVNDQKQYITDESRLSGVLHERLQRWVEPHGEWHGFFKELADSCGDNNIQILFVGTKDDLDDLCLARNKYARQLGITVDIQNKLSIVQQYDNSATNKMMQIQKLYNELEAGQIEELKSQDIKDAFTNAVKSDFEIVVIAPVSSGKSTIQNAMLGRRLLPVSNKAKTAVLTRTRINCNLDGFQVETKRVDSVQESFDGPVTQQLITELNDELDPNDPQKETALREVIYLQGPAEQFAQSELNLVFVDTPGGNNAMNQKHKAVMRKALKDENKSLILFVFSATTIDYEDTKDVLEEIADEMRQSMNGKLSQDRFLFACNCADEMSEPLDQQVEDLKRKLEACGITDPNLFLVSGRTAELIRAHERNEMLAASGREEEVDVFSDDDEDNLESHRNKMSRDSKALYRHSSLPEKAIKEFEDEVQKLKAEGEGKGSMKIALVNSGIPALEYTINEYLRKYAIPMKIEQVHETFMRKVRERQMVDHCKERWTESEKNLEEARQVINEQLKHYEESKELKEYQDKVMEIRLNKQPIYDKQAELKQRLHDESLEVSSDAVEMEVEGKYGTWLKRDKADIFINRQKKRIEAKMQDISRAMVKELNSGIVESCNNIMDDYRKCIEKLNKAKTFDLAGLRLDAFDEFREYEAENVDLEIGRRSEVVGQKQVPKSGFFNAIKRFFGSTGGYSWENVYGDVEYVEISTLRQNQLAEANQAFDDAVSEYIDQVEENVEELKKQVCQKMDKLDKFITDIYETYQTELANGDKLKEKVAANKQNVEWLDQFVQKVDKLLDIEEAI